MYCNPAAEQRAFRDQIRVVRLDKDGNVGWRVAFQKHIIKMMHRDLNTNYVNIGDLFPNGSQTLFRLH